jgi:hypothetical protein
MSTLSPPRDECDGLDSPTAASEPSDDIWQLLASPRLLASSGDAPGAMAAIPSALSSLTASGHAAVRGAEASAVRTTLVSLLAHSPPLGRLASPHPLVDPGDAPCAMGAIPFAPSSLAAPAGLAAACGADASVIRTPLGPLSSQRPPAARPSRGQLLQAAALKTAHGARQGASRKQQEAKPGAALGIPPAVAEYALRRAWHLARSEALTTERARTAPGPEAVLRGRAARSAAAQLLILGPFRAQRSARRRAP